MIYLWWLLVDIPISILRVIVAILGIIVVPVALLFKTKVDGVYHLPRLFAWWDNPDYGIYGNHSYRTSKAYNPLFYKNPYGFGIAFYWLAIRNPANGLTQSKLFSVSQSDCNYVKYKGQVEVDNYVEGWQFVYARRGWRLYTGFYYLGKFGEWRIGFKLLPKEPNRKRRVGNTFIPNPFKGINK